MASASERDDITVLTWNLCGMKAKLEKREKKDRLLAYFQNYDIVLLQETHIGKPKDTDPERAEKDWKRITKSFQERYVLKRLEDQIHTNTMNRMDRETMYMTYFSSSRKGVAILINKPHIFLAAFYKGGDCAWVHVEIDSQRYTFVSVYHHPKIDLICTLMLEIYLSFLEDDSGAFKSRFVIGGDFNTSLDPKLDANKEVLKHISRRKTLKQFLSTAKLSDVWREKNGNRFEYTHTQRRKRRQRTPPAKCRLDYVFMREDDVKNYVENCDIRTDLDLSDHFPVSLTLKKTKTNDIQQHREE